MSGKNKFYSALAMALLLVAVAGATAQAKVAASALPMKPPTLGPNWVKFQFSTAMATKATISLSARDNSCAMSLMDNNKKVHNVTVPALQPATPYRYCIKATPVKGKPLTASGTFTTSSPEPAQLEVRNGKITLNGSLFIPIMANGYDCPDTAFIGAVVDLGGKILLNSTGCSSDPTAWASDLHPLLANKLWLIVGPKHVQYLAELPELLQMPAAAAMNGRLNIGSCNNTNDDHMMTTYVQDLKKAAANQPVIFQADISTPWGSRQNCFDAPSMSAFLGTALTTGVQGYSFNSILTVNPHGMSAKEELKEPVRNFTKMLATFGPALQAGKTVAVSASDKNISVLGKKYGGVTYLFTQNTDRTASHVVTFKVPGLSRPLTQDVSRGVRNLQVAGNTFNDKLEPLGWRIYKLVPRPKKK